MARNNKLELDSSGIGTWSTADGRFSIVRRSIPINPMEATSDFKIRIEYSIHSFEDYDGPTQYPQLAPEIGRIDTFKEAFPWLGEYTGEGSFELGNPSLLTAKPMGGNQKIEETMNVLEDVFCEAKFLPKDFVLGVQGWWNSWKNKWKHIDAKDSDEFSKISLDLLDEAINSFRELSMYLRNEHGYWDQDDYKIDHDPRGLVKSLLRNIINALGNSGFELLYGMIEKVASGDMTIHQATSKMVQFTRDVELDHVNTLLSILKRQDKRQPTSFDRVEQKFNIGKVKFLVQFADKYKQDVRNPRFNPSKVVPMLVKAGDMAMQFMKRAGFGFMWRGKIWSGPRGEGYPDPINRQRIKSGERKIMGFYTPKGDRIVLYPGNQLWGEHSEIAYTLIHEMAHRYWYKHLSKERREQFVKWFGTIDAASEYGATSPKEDFSETMTEYILNPSELTTSQRDRLVQIVKPGGRFVQKYEDKDILEDVFGQSL